MSDWTNANYDKNQTRQQHDQSIDLVYAKTKNELSRLIWPGAVYDES